MLVRKISIFIIITIILIELYLKYFVELEVNNTNTFSDTNLDDVQEVIIVDKKPWTKIKEKKDKNEYYIIIKQFDELKYLEWKEMIEGLEYDITDKELMIPSIDEERAISIVNLMISNMKNDINMQEILDKDLINKSIKKSRKYNVVFQKILNLVIENNIDESANILEQMKINDIEEIKNTKVDINIPKQKITHVKPEEYNYDGFKNSHNEIFKTDKLIRNNLTANAYSGKQYARPFRH